EGGLKVGFPTASAGKLRAKTRGTGAADCAAAAVSRIWFSAVRSSNEGVAAGASGKPFAAELGSTACARRLLANAARADCRSAAVVVAVGFSPAVRLASLERADGRSIVEILLRHVACVGGSSQSSSRAPNLAGAHLLYPWGHA